MAAIVKPASHGWHHRAVPKAGKLAGLALALIVMFAAGALLAGVINAATSATAQATTTTETRTTTATETTTSATTTTLPASTVYETTTIQHTTTRPVPATTSTAASSSSEGNGTPDWVWVLLAILAVGLITLIVLLALRGRDGVSAEERQHQLDAAVGSWVAQGWAIETQTADSAVLRRGNEAMLVSIDSAGHVSTRPLPAA